MKTILGLLCATMLLMVGCAHDRGGTSDDYYKGYGTRMTQTITMGYIAARREKPAAHVKAGRSINKSAGFVLADAGTIAIMVK